MGTGAGDVDVDADDEVERVEEEEEEREVAGDDAAAESIACCSMMPGCDVRNEPCNALTPVRSTDDLH